MRVSRRVNRRHQDDGHDEHDDGVGRVHHRRADHRADGVQIVGRARHQVAGPPRLIVRERHLLQPGEEGVAQVVFDLPRGADEDAAHQEAEGAADERDRQQQRRVHRELPARHAGIEIVDCVLQHPGRQQLNRRRHDDAGQAEKERSLVPQEEREQTGERRGHLWQYIGAALKGWQGSRARAFNRQRSRPERGATSFRGSFGAGGNAARPVDELGSP